MKDIFTGDIFEKIEPPHDVSFKIVGTALPTNQDMYFVAKWHEIFERYTSARLFVRKALEDNWDYWFNKMEDEKVQCAIEYKFKAELYETALLSYNILVDLSWAWTYVSAEYLLYNFDADGNVTNAKDVCGMHPIEEAYDAFSSGQYPAVTGRCGEKGVFIRHRNRLSDMQQEAIYFRGCYDSVGYLKKAVIL